MLSKSSQAQKVKTAIKRGDTIVEVMFAVAVFALVAVLSITMMNAGVAVAERSLEAVVARNEINAQVEALRYIHSSYIAEKTLPACIDTTEKCQQFNSLWNNFITNRAITPTQYSDLMYRDGTPLPNLGCQELYNNDNAVLRDAHAFIINTRTLFWANDRISSYATLHPYVSATARQTLSNKLIFQPALLGSRIIFVNHDNDDYDTNYPGESSADDMATTDPANYDRVGQVDGLWVIAVNDGSDNTRSKYFDFYIGACWYGTNSNAPTTLDTVIRLYNPEGDNRS